jgi:hypothetical protein
MNRGLFDCEIDTIWPEISPGDDASLQLDVGFATLRVIEASSFEDMSQVADNFGFSGPFKDAVIACWQKRNDGTCIKQTQGVSA